MGGEGERQVQPEAKVFGAGHKLQFRAISTEDFRASGGIMFPVKNNALGFLGNEGKIKAMKILLNKIETEL